MNQINSENNLNMGPVGKPSVTVAVSAFNEENNIAAFLKSISEQVEDGFTIDSIIIVSDGSTDRTVALARACGLAKCQVIDYQERLGKSARLKEVYAVFSSDILVQFDADVVLGHVFVLRDIVWAFSRDKSVMVCGDAIPLPPETFTEKAVFCTAMAYAPLKKLVRGGNNIFSVTGCVIAYLRAFITGLNWPDDLASDDLYTYLACRANGHNYSFAEDAKVYFRLPQNLSDHIKQSTRFAEMRRRMKNIFSGLYDREFNIPVKIAFMCKFQQFSRHPLLCSYIYMINKYCAFRAGYLGHTIKPAWDIAKSTKTLKYKIGATIFDKISRNEIYFQGFLKKFFNWRPSGKYVIACFMFFCAFILLLSLRGLPGNPSSAELNTSVWKEDGPFELSPERGRFALLYSIAENKALSFTGQLAEFIVPDLGLSPDGRFVSLFTPGISFLALPGYLAGKFFNLSQIGAFAVIALFALANCWLIIRISQQLGARLPGAIAGAATFLFATPAFAYAVSFYQHHITVFLILLSLYLLLKNYSWVAYGLVWFLTGVSLLIDSPNFFLLFPVGIFALIKILSLKFSAAGAKVNVNLPRLAMVLFILPPLLLLGWYNFKSHGNAFKLSGTLPAVAEITEQGNIASFKASEPQVYGNTADKQAISFFATRNLLKGFYSHFLSPDRGIIRFAPVILLGVFGLLVLYRRNVLISNIFLAIIGLNVLLYSMWGDPYGGWAFGSRYLIPAYAILAIGISVWLGLTRYRYAAILIFCFLFGYSAWVNSLGALTSNMNPPQIEVLQLEASSKKVEKYTFDRNWDYLINKGSKSFVWRSYLKPAISASAYHRLIYGSILGFVLVALFYGRVLQGLKKLHLAIKQVVLFLLSFF